MPTEKFISLHKGGALANIDRPSRLIFRNTKPGWHETGRAQREVNHRCCLTRIGEANQAVLISTAGGAVGHNYAITLLISALPWAAPFWDSISMGVLYHFFVILHVAALAK
jgi:hypothetical protein